MAPLIYPALKYFLKFLLQRSFDPPALGSVRLCGFFVDYGGDPI